MCISAAIIPQLCVNNAQILEQYLWQFSELFSLKPPFYSYAHHFKQHLHRYMHASSRICVELLNTYYLLYTEASTHARTHTQLYCTSGAMIIVQPIIFANEQREKESEIFMILFFRRAIITYWRNI